MYPCSSGADRMAFEWRLNLTNDTHEATHLEDGSRTFKLATHTSSHGVRIMTHRQYHVPVAEAAQRETIVSVWRSCTVSARILRAKPRAESRNLRVIRSRSASGEIGAKALAIPEQPAPEQAAPSPRCPPHWPHSGRCHAPSTIPRPTHGQHERPTGFTSSEAGRCNSACLP